MSDVVQVTGRVLASRPVGDYRHLTIAAPGVAGAAQPGHFVAVAVGGPTSANLLRRCFSLHGVGTGPDGDTLDVVIAGKGPGTQWLVGLGAGAPVDVVAPLGTPFPLPDPGTSCVLVGGGYGSAPLFWLAQVLRDQGCPVQIVLGAATPDRLYGTQQATLVADGVTITTDDGSLGVRGWVSDVLPEVLTDSAATVTYSCGPMGMLQSVAEVSARLGAQAHVAVEESMACGIGVCMTCVLPVRAADGRTKMVRSCVEGPVFDGASIRWEAFSDGVCRVPADAVGAPRPGGH